ncbi:hypothetical protein DFH07DRAFT_52812 [Mycena maculata]|uniref:Uncharacterized protein n=1 Tax=Mycena maculata TaxID=230809 RepID=A0AAD7IEV9_9AGAR|nr:hypothetical protein DFH07DRAFT_52812 [Mycena maculata]
MYPSSSKIVDTIHTLRGEYFRHTQNQKRLPPNLRSRTVTHNTSTLPADLLGNSAYSKDSQPIHPRDTRQALFVPKRVDRPQHDLTSTASWRADAVSVILPAVVEDSKVPLLTLFCLRILITFSDADFWENILPFIPPHLRHDLLRWTAIHRPLTNPQLAALCGSNGHISGELIIVGPTASVREDQFEPLEARHPVEWDSDDSLPPPMHTFILVSAHLALSALRSLPATLTRLALVNVTAVSLHRLPTTCPLLEHLDLSYNTWLVAEKETRERLGKVQWSRWRHLRELGVRECHIPEDIMAAVNKGRWDDIKVVK